MCHSFVFSPGLYLPREFWGVLATEAQHLLQLRDGGGDERDRIIPLTLLHLPQSSDKLCLDGINQTWQAEGRKGQRSIVKEYRPGFWYKDFKKKNETHLKQFTSWADQGDAGQVSRILGGIHPCNIATHRASQQMEWPFIQTNTLHKLHRGNNSFEGREETGYIYFIGVSNWLLCDKRHKRV